MKRRWHVTMLLALLAALAGASRADGSPLTDLIAAAKAVGSERAAGEVSFRYLEHGMVQLGTSAANVTEALDVLDAHSEPDDVLVGLLRGLALFDAYPVAAIETRIQQTFCSYSHLTTPLLREEALESIRIRCVVVPSACSCPP